MSARTSRFAACHPAVSFLFFAVVIVAAVVIRHPAYLAVSFCGASALLATLKGKKGLRTVAALLPLFLVIAALNPLFNSRGEHVLLSIFGRPYTLEALCGGMVIAGILVTALIWFADYSAVITEDKFTFLFGGLLPSLSLLLTMVLRLLPAYRRKAAQITGARRCIGLGAAAQSGLRTKLGVGMASLSALTGWALEDSVTTADSMRARGYGTSRRTGFSVYRMTGADVALLAVLLLLAGTALCAVLMGWTRAAFTPLLDIAPIRGASLFGLLAYGVLALVPALMNLLEAFKWHLLQSRI